MSSALLVLVLQLLHGVPGQVVVVEDPVSAPPPSLVEQDGSDGIVPALFVFGDSLIDNGNNNNIPSFAKANYFPYGIDFNGGPTGRFSNGLTMVDGIGTFFCMSSYLMYKCWFKLCFFSPWNMYFPPNLEKGPYKKVLKINKVLC